MIQELFVSLATKLSLAFSGLIATVALAAWMVYSSAQQAFDQVDQQRTKAVLAQFQQRLAASKADLHQRINQAANSEVIRKILVSPGNLSFTIEAAAKRSLPQALRRRLRPVASQNATSTPWPDTIGRDRSQ